MSAGRRSRGCGDGRGDDGSDSGGGGSSGNIPIGGAVCVKTRCIRETKILIIT